MVENLYNDRILKLAASLSKVGKIECAEFSSEAISRLCGSKVTVDLDISKNINLQKLYIGINYHML